MENIPKVILFAASAAQYLQSDSESESDSDFEDLFLISIQKPRTKRRRVSNFVNDVVDYYTEEEFRRNFRLKRTTADIIINRYKESEFYRTNVGKGRRNLPADEQMYAFLWFSANKNSYHEICNLFNFSESSFYKCLNNILDFLYDISKTIIRFPEVEAEKEEIATDFRSVRYKLQDCMIVVYAPNILYLSQIAGFPYVIGCIDGSYISIRKPANKIRSTYINRHDMLSITLQGICDAKRRFLDVCIGSPSRIHDSRVYSLSPISDEISAICHGRYHLLGDAAYPLREHLLTPFKDYGNLTHKERNYNLKHSQTRVKIENSFSNLKGRFRQLLRLDFFHVERMSKFVLACCTLHNMCINQNDIYDENENENDPDDALNEIPPVPIAAGSSGSQNVRNTALRRLGEVKRNEIATGLLQ
ncbi:putative nuclease HARBI1 [Armigeres subalbatus]|uniref:putative nuclease HARBI1 n=1 Tax=Armigeres subalbatus TaxID=124917 RepID=UPI002ED2A8E4